MPSAPPIDRYQPSFYRFPIQCARTGFKPVYLPVILVVPGRRDERGFVLANSEVRNVRFYIADAPDPSKVAGTFLYTPTGPVANNILVPPLSQYVVNINSLQLTDVWIDPSQHTFIGSDGQRKVYEDAVDGDLMEYTLIRGNTTSTVVWHPDADYYDVSLFTIDVEDLPRPKHYLFVWECQYNRREVRTGATSVALGSFCISASDGLAQFQMWINHPGEVHNEMFRKTPPFYFDNDNFALADDPILEFYRPFADLLQDTFDEQTFLDGINHIDRVPAQLIPYLAYLIGWDLPNFPGVTDNVRRSILRQAVHLQQLKGSRRALIELFEIFGFTIDLINLWYSSNGERLIAPGDELPAQEAADEIKVRTVKQVEPLASDYTTTGFGQLDIPLLYRATSNIFVMAYQVMPGPSEDALTAIAEDIENQPDQALANQLASFDRSTLISMSEVEIDYKTGRPVGSASSTKIPLINEQGILYAPDQNLVHVNFDHYMNFSDGSTLFIFAVYNRTELVVPDQIKNLRSNRFDVQILLRTGQRPDPQLLEFLLNFVFKLKAFHSLLRKIIFNLDIWEVYGVQDYCLTPTSIGPPGSQSNEGSEGVCDPGNMTEEEKTLQDTIYQGLLEEFKTWRALDGTHNNDPLLDKFLRLPVQEPEGTQCQFTQYGQNRVEASPDADHDQVPDTRPKLCADVSPLPPHCFPGRVQDKLIIDQDMLLCEYVRLKPCTLGYGSGFYWLYPQNALSILRNGFGHFDGQNSTSFLGKEISDYGRPLPKSLHYTNRPYLTDYQLNSDQLLAYHRTSLEIQKDNLFYSSHRFLSWANLLDDFTHPTWKAKPWDYNDNDLNAKLEVNSYGNQYLVYDDVALIYYGNGIEADISSFGIHADRSFVVTHKVYLTNPPGHPAVTLSPMVTETTYNEIGFDSSSPFGPIFRSYNPDCNKDFRSGYPSVTGRFEVDINQIDFDRGAGTDLLGQLLGLPVRGVTASNPPTALFTYGSGVLVTSENPEYKYYEPFRYDCECERFGCTPGSSGVSAISAVTSGIPVFNVGTCILDQFKLGDGTYDWNNDQIDIDPTVVLQEKVGVCSAVFDGQIPNFLCIMNNGNIPTNSQILPSGSFKWKDDYGMIYEGTWIYKQGVLDIVYQTKQPSVWGQPPEGFVLGRLVYRKGVITTIRQVIKVFADGTYNLLGYIADQRVDFFQTNLACNDALFVDNFCYHFDCAVQDDIDLRVKCGTRWTDVGDTQVVWPDIGGAIPVGKQPFVFMNVWGNAEAPDLTALCPVSSASS